MHQAEAAMAFLLTFTLQFVIQITIAHQLEKDKHFCFRVNDLMNLQNVGMVQLVQKINLRSQNIVTRRLDRRHFFLVHNLQRWSNSQVSRLSATTDAASSNKIQKFRAKKIDFRCTFKANTFPLDFSVTCFTTANAPDPSCFPSSYFDKTSSQSSSKTSFSIFTNSKSIFHSSAHGE